MTSSNNFCITDPFWGNLLITSAFLSKRPVTWSFDVFFDLCPNKRLNKQSGCRWFERFETPPRSLWRYCNVLSVIFMKHMSLYLCVLFQLDTRGISSDNSTQSPVTQVWWNICVLVSLIQKASNLIHGVTETDVPATPLTPAVGRRPSIHIIQCWRRYYVKMTSFWRYNDVIILSYVQWESASGLLPSESRCCTYSYTRGNMINIKQHEISGVGL